MIYLFSPFQTKIFTSVENIPAEFIAKHVKLLGRVKSIGDHGTLHVMHTPILRLPFRAQKQGKIMLTHQEQACLHTK